MNIAKVTGLVATPDASSIVLSWDAAPDAYWILVEKSSNGVAYSMMGLLVGSATTVEDTSVVQGETYYYRVRFLGETRFSSKAVIVTGSVAIPPGFISTWRTTTPGETITLPLRTGYTYDFTVDWGDGSSDTITSPTAPERVHAYATPGDYTVSITGGFPTIYFNNGGDKLKIIAITSFGDVGWTTLANAFWGCSNLATILEGGQFAAVTSLANAFKSCASLTSFPEISIPACASVSAAWNLCTSMTSFSAMSDTDNVNNWGSAWYGCSNLTSFPSLDYSSGTLFTSTWRDCNKLTSFPDFNAPSATNLSEAWRGCSKIPSIVVDTPSATSYAITFYQCSLLTACVISSMRNAASFNLCWTGAPLTTPVYDAILISLEANNILSSVPLTANLAKYSPAAATARANLVSRGWTITDGGPA